MDGWGGQVGGRVQTSGRRVIDDPEELYHDIETNLRAESQYMAEPEGSGVGRTICKTLSGLVLWQGGCGCGVGWWGLDLPHGYHPSYRRP